MKTCFTHLGAFIRALDEKGEIEVITDPVSPYLEISRRTDLESKRPGGGKALFFKNVEGSGFPVATNLFGSDRRICMALGVDSLDELAERIRGFLKIKPPGNLKELLRLVPKGLEVTRWFPRNYRSGKPPCQEVIHTGSDVDLTKIPALHCWPDDGGRFITLPLVFTKNLSTGKPNLGMYRMQIFDKNTTGMHWHIHKDGSHDYNGYLKAGKRMPVSVAIGADPATIYSATAPLPRDLDELMLAGFIRRRPVRMTRCITNDIRVPAEAEFVLEGYVDPGELRREGPFGDHTGFYSLADDYPVFHVTAITHRKSPVFSATLVGPPPMEDCYLAKATERMFLPLLQTAFPEIVDYSLPWEGVFHNIVIVAIEKEFPMHARKVMYGLWGQGQMSFCKAVVVVDKSIDPKDHGSVLAAFLEKFDLNRDMVHAQGILDVLDHSAPFPKFGNKVGIDLTEPFPGEPARKEVSVNKFPRNFDSESLFRKLNAELPDSISNLRIVPPSENPFSSPPQNRIVLVAVKKKGNRNGKFWGEFLGSRMDDRDGNIVVFFDFEEDLRNSGRILWKLFNNVDPGRDFFRSGNRLVVDACRKGPQDGFAREWPDELMFDKLRKLD